MKRSIALPLIILATLLFSSNAFGFNNLDDVVEVQQYTRAIHIMAMLLVGFGFLMVFVKNYGRSALTATFLLVSVAIPFYFLVLDSGWFFHGKSQIETLILAEFAAASLLIAAGAVLGRLKMYQYIILGLLFVPFYMFNEWSILDNGLGLITGKFADTGGSIIIHAFGALFGVGVALSMTTKKTIAIPIEADATSDRFSMLGSMILWIFWPSFCAALVPTADIPYTVVNVIFALSGSTIATYIISVWVRGKINIADIANAALAGGVAIGATVDFATHPMALLIGVIAGVISTLGFTHLQSKQQSILKAIDTCGVTNLHGLPGLMGGFAAIFVVKGINTGAQVIGILFTVVAALISGYITGKIISLFGHRKKHYEDVAEFEDV